MAQTLTVTPSTAVPGSIVSVHGDGFTRYSITLTLSSSSYISTFRAKADGTFDVGAIVSGTDGTYTLKASVSGIIVAQTTITVKKPAPPPPPPPPPALTISAVTVSAITQTGATIGWTVSDFATGQVEYGMTSAYGNKTTLEPSFTYKAHIQKITGLLAGTGYHFRCVSKDQAGNIATSPDGTFTTLAAAAPPAPTNLVVTPGHTTATAGWQ